MKHGAAQPPSVLGKASDVLACFTPARPTHTLANITRTTGLAHATARRIVGELTEYGLLERTSQGTFSIGLRMWELGALSPNALSLRSTAMPIMTVLHASLHQHVQLAVHDGDEALIVERLSSSKSIDVISQVGGRLPLHSSGVGKVFLAHLDPETLSRIIGQGLPKLTSTTITDGQALRRELAAVRSRGYSTVREESSIGAESVAAPIINRTGVVAALSVVIPAQEIDLERLAPAVISGAQAISAGLTPNPSGREESRK